MIVVSSCVGGGEGWGGGVGGGESCGGAGWGRRGAQTMAAVRGLGGGGEDGAK